jgi:hypothetical protein
VAEPAQEPAPGVDPALMDNAALQAELRALQPLTDRDALADPLTMAMHLDRRIVSRPHLRVISQCLAGLSPTSGDRVLITTPPQVGKTEVAAIWGVFWWLAKYPASRVIIGSYGTLLATKRGRAVRKRVQQYGGRYGLLLEQGVGAAADWQLTTGGGVRSAGIGAGITGEPASVAIIDDPVKGRVEADSPAIREKTWNWWSGDLTSRLAPGAPVLLVMTRWSDDDIAARLLADEGTVDEGGRWRVVAMPAIAVPEDRKHGIYPDALGREPGEPLSHPKIRTSDRASLLRHWENKRRSSTPRDWGALYQGNPRPVEGALVDREILRKRCHFDIEVTALKHGVAVDPSGGGRDTAGIVAGFLGADRRLYLTHDLTGRMPTEQWSEKACLLAYETTAEQILVENNYGADMALRVVRAAWKDLVDRGEIPAGVLPPRIVAVHARKGKLLRAEPIAAQIVLDNVRFAAPMPELLEEWATWQPLSTTSPGRIDASVHLAVGMLPIAGLQALAGSVIAATGVSRRQATGNGASGMPSIPRARGERTSNVINLDRYLPAREGSLRLPS